MMKKKALSLLLVLALCLTLLPTAALAEGGQDPAAGQEGTDLVPEGPNTADPQLSEDENTGGTESGVTEAANEEELKAAVLQDGTIRLTENIDLTETLVIPSGRVITLDLNGKAITANFDGTAAIDIQSGQYVNNQVTRTTVDLIDSKGGGIITHGTHENDDGKTVKYYGRGLSLGSYNTLSMYGGSICGNEFDPDDGVYSHRGAGISVSSSAEFNMNGGSIWRNQAIVSDGDEGGGVYVSGTFNMYDGEISGNNSAGGGVAVEGGVFNMTGGIITGNAANARSSSGIRFGGGVFLGSGTVTVGGTAQITGNVYGGKLDETTGRYVKDDGEDKLYSFTGDSNVYLYVGDIAVSQTAPLEEGAAFGVTTNTAPTSTQSCIVVTNAEESDLSYFSSDKNYKLEYDSENRQILMTDTQIKHRHTADDGAGTQFEKALTSKNGLLYIDGEMAAVSMTYKSSVGANGYGYELPEGNYYLEENLALQNYSIKISKNVTLCLNNKTITAQHDQAAIYIMDDASFTLTDCGTEGKIVHEAGRTHRGVYVGYRATFRMYNGIITEHHTDARPALDGAGVFADGNVEMHGGTITGNSTAGTGGGVFNRSDGTFILYDGAKITGNSAKYGGGVAVSGKTEMLGGEISGNSATYGGGVYVDDFYKTDLITTGGTITGNNADENGGGVYVTRRYSGYESNGETMTVSGLVDITGNTLGGAEDGLGGYTGGQVNNVCLSSDMVMAIGEGGLTPGAAIGVNVRADIAEGCFELVSWNATEDVLNYITSDDPSYSLGLTSTMLYLSNGAPAHQHYLCSSTVNGVCPDGHTESEQIAFTPWTDEIAQRQNGTGKTAANSLPTRPGSYYLTKDVKLEDSASWEPRNGLFLCLHGCDISSTYAGAVIFIRTTGCTFTLTDCSEPGNQGKITHEEGVSGRGVYVYGTAVFNMYGGNITGNNSSNTGSGVCISRWGTLGKEEEEISSFNMYGGSITNNHTDVNGGGVRIEQNRVKTAFTMYGGEISGNSAGEYGGGIYFDGSNRVILRGQAKITGNTTSKSGGGVYVGCSTEGTLTVSDSVQITGNLRSYTSGSRSDDNVYLPSGATVNVSGELSGTAAIGVRMLQAGTVSSNISEASAARFTSDLPTYELSYTGTDLVMSKRGEHTHCICGAQHHYINGDHSYNKITWTPISSETQLLDTVSGGHYYLVNNITLTTIDENRQITWTPAEDVTLCLNGYSLQTSGPSQTVTVQGSFTLTDCAAEEQVGTIVGAGHINSVSVWVMSGTFTMYGGKITGAARGVTGKQSTTFKMYGGSITGNTAGTYLLGAGIYTLGSVVLAGKMNISGNTVNGAVSNILLDDGATLTINGELDAASRIGVTTKTPPASGAPIIIATGLSDKNYDNYRSIFFSDVTDQGFAVARDADTLTLIVEHRHPVCGAASCSHEGHDNDAVWLPIGSEEELRAAAADGYYYLTKDVTLTEERGWSPANNAHLCLNGHALIGPLTGQESIAVREGITFTLTDCGSTGTITHNSKERGSAITNIGTFFMYGGSFTNNYLGVLNSGSMTVAGKVRITGNGMNVLLPEEGKTIAIGVGGLAAGSEIGVYVDRLQPITEAVTIVTNASASDVGYFQNDLTGQNLDIRYADGTLILAPHQHDFGQTGVCSCGTAAEAKYNSVYYVTLEEALAAAKADSDKTVLVLKEITRTEEITLDTDGLTLSLEGVSIHATLVITGSNISIDELKQESSATIDKLLVRGGGSVQLRSPVTVTALEAAEDAGKVTLVAGCKLGSVQLGGKYLSDLLQTTGSPLAFQYTDGSGWVSYSETLNGKQLLQETLVQIRPIRTLSCGVKNSPADYGSTVQPVLSVTYSLGDGYSEMPTFRWSVKKAGADSYTEIAGATGAVYTVPLGQDAARYNYTCEVTLDGYTISTTSVVMINQADAVLRQAPTAKEGLVYDDGNALLLVEAGQAEGGTIQYAVYQNGQALAPASTVLPSATEAGTYTVRYTLVPDSNHKLSTAASGSFTVTIAQAEPVCAVPTGLTAVYGQLLSTVSLSNPTGNTAGRWTWNAAEGQLVGAKGTQTFQATFTPDSSNYKTVTKNVTLTVTAKPISTPTLEISGSYTYNGQQIKPTPTVKAGELTLTEGTDYVLTYGENINAGNGSVTITANPESNYSFDKGVTNFPILQRKVKISGIQAEDKIYDGSTAAALVYSGVVFDGKLAEDELTLTAAGTFRTADASETETRVVDLSNLTLGGRDKDNYAIDATYSQWTASAYIRRATLYVTGTAQAAATYGTQVKDIEIRGLVVTLPTAGGTVAVDGSWKFSSTDKPNAGNTTAYTATFEPTNGAENYNVLTRGIVPTITPAKGKDLGTATISLTYADTGTKTYKPDWSGLPGDQHWEYSCGASVRLPEYSIKADGSELTYAIPAGSASGDRITLTLTASCSNYEDYTWTLILNITDQLPQPGIEVESDSISMVYGDSAQVVVNNREQLVGDLSYTVIDGSGVISVDEEGRITTLKAGRATIRVEAAGSSQYQPTWKTVTVLVSQRVISVTVDDQTMIAGGKMPEFTVSYGNFAYDDTAETVLDSLPVPTTTANGKTSGTFDITMEAPLLKPGMEEKYTIDTPSIGTLTVHPNSGDAAVYPIQVSRNEHGTVSVSPKAAVGGSTVTITVRPDSGYRLDDLTVTDSQGNRLSLTDKGSGSYTFTMPFAPAEVSVRFAAETEHSPFLDVSKDKYYYEAVKWAAEQGIADGIGNGLFGPEGFCTRAQIVTFLWRAAGSPEPQAMSSFTDVPAEVYYAKAVAWAVEQGIAKGTGDGKFSPDALCTRGQIVTFLWRRTGVSEVQAANSFTDVSAEAYYAKAIAWAVEQGIAKGTGDGKFSPNGTCTRAQSMTFLWRLQAGK